MAQAACRAYAEAVRALDKLPPANDEGATVEAARLILHTLVGRLNAVEGRSGMIDTLRREEAGEAFASLAARSGIRTELANRWFDEWRDF